MKKIVTVLVAWQVCCATVSAQEILLPVQSNPQKIIQEKGVHKKSAQPVVLQLPFREDFSYTGPYPDQRLWADSFAFVNSTFAVHPKTVGVATFDAINQHGLIYDRANESSFQFVADYLTSHPIALGSLTPADSVLLTFYYQPQGLGSPPRQRDSLVVEFLKTPGYFMQNESGQTEWVPDEWQSVWRAEGETLASFSGNRFPYFKRAAIFITDPVFFRNNFRFRFKNYSSFAIPTTKTPDNMAGNNNIWNIDYIWLDRGRSKLITTYFDIAFAAPAPSILRNYTSMPWSHYIVNPAAQLKSNFELSITNLGDIVYNYIYRYFIQDEQGTNIRTYSGGTWNIAPFSQDGYQNYQPHSRPIVISNPLPTTPASERTFRIIHVIREGLAGDNFQRNDTITFNQVFSNYFAYDDGVPESGYGLVGRNARGAYRFVLSRPDTLRAVQIFFNRTLNESNIRAFNLMVWSNLDPEQVIYESKALTPAFVPGLNGFVTYTLNTPVPVSGTIFVGWKQIADGFLNIGYDANSKAGQHIFFNVGNQWMPSIYTGALMIRPFFGIPGQVVSVNDKVPNPFSISIYPNPISGNTLYIKANETLLSEKGLMIEVFDMHGRRVVSEEFSPTIDLGGLGNGVYILRLTHPKSHLYYSNRFIIAR